MSPAERLFWTRVQRRAAHLQPDLARAMLRGFLTLRENLSDAEMERLIRTGSVERLLAENFDPTTLDRAFAVVRAEVRGGVEDAARAFGRDFPRTAQMPGIAFDVLNPRIVDAIRVLNTRVVATLTDDVRETVRAHVENGLRDGIGPRAIARDLRGVIGLGPSQLQEVQNFRDALLGQNGRRWQDYTLRDRRFDGVLRRLAGPEDAGLPAARVDAMTETYLRRRIAQNTGTIARTAALDAQKLGQRLTWEAAVERGDVDGERLMKRWAGVMDDRERDEHVAMEGETVGWDEPYSNGQMQPGENEFNCFIPGTVVEGAFVAGLKVNYTGPLREIKTARGHRLTTTPNHPILTPDGWVAAGELQKGGALLCDRRDVNARGAAGDNVHHEDRPSPVEKVFEALAAHRPATVRRAAGLDLHGDAQWTRGDVHVVGANVQLWHESYALVADCLDDRSLDPAEVYQVPTPRFGTLELNRETVLLASPRLVGGGDLSPDEFRTPAHFRPLEPLRLGAPADWHAPLAEPSKQDDALVPAFIRQLLEAGAGAIARDEIVEVRDFQAATHLYDLQSVDGWMIAQGIVCSNCRCVSIFFQAQDPLTARRQGVGAAGISIEDALAGAARAREAA